MDKKDYIFGIRSIIEAIEAGKSLDKIYIRKEAGGELIRELYSKASEYDIPVQKVPLEKLNRITLKNHQGAVAILSPVIYFKLENIVPEIYESGKTPLCVILDGVTDSRNFGAIARSAECAGADFILIPETGNASVTSDSMKASAGALFHIPVCRTKDLKSSVRFLKESGYKIVGATEKSHENYCNENYDCPLGLVMGSEEKGISENILKLCDFWGAIPILGKIGSLNVSVATGVYLYEIIRQRMNLT